MPPPLGAWGIMFSGCPPVHPKPEIPFFHLYMGPLVHPTNRDRFSARPSVCPGRFPGISRWMYRGNGLKFCMMIYPDHLQHWVVFGHGLLIFLLLASFWLSEMGHICGFWALPEECMEGMARNFAYCCIVTTFRNMRILVVLCWFSSLWSLFDLMTLVIFAVSRHYLENACE